MTESMVSLTIDDQKVLAEPGQTIATVAEAAGIHIPTFCNHEKLVPVGACRMCLVEIEGVRGLQTSCTTPVREGMVVKVHTSPAAVKARKANIEFLLTNHPLDCPVCDKGGECPLQNQALLDGPGQSRYVEEKRHKNKRYPLGELMVLDQERCVLCWRCVRFLDEWADDHELDLFGRGATTRIDTFPGRPLASKWQGNTIDICPVGALTSRIFRFEARVWELSNTASICPLCAVGCNTIVGVKNNQIRRITPRENPEVNDVWLCDKGRFAHGFVDDPGRLKTPLVRRDGRLQPATWEEALGLIAQRLSRVVEEEGPQAVAGLGSARVNNEANYLFQRFMRTVVGTNNVDHLRRLPAGARPPTSLSQIEERDVVFLLGTDPGVSAPLVELWIKKAALRHGARIMVANPWRTGLERYGGPWLGYRPGSESILLGGLARAILDTGLEDQATRVTNMDDLNTWLQDFSPARVEYATGVPADQIRNTAQALAQAASPIFLYGPTWVRGAGGESGSTPNLAALENLSLLVGGVETGFLAEDSNTLGALEMGMVPDLYPGRRSCQDTQSRVRSRLTSVWGGKLSPVVGLDFNGMMAAAQDGRLKAMWIMGADPATDCRVAVDALGRIPFLIVQDQFATDTASLADVVLPAAAYAETSGSTLNVTGRLQAYQPAKRPPGQARADWWIITELARNMVEANRLRSWEFDSAKSVLREISKVLPEYRGLNLDALQGAGWQSPPAEPQTRRSFRRVEEVQIVAEPDYPLALVFGRLLYDRGTLLAHCEPLQKLVPDAYVMIHSDDAEKLGIADGEDAVLVSSHGRVGLRVQVCADVAPGVACAPRNLSDVPLSALAGDRWHLPRVRIETCTQPTGELRDRE